MKSLGNAIPIVKLIIPFVFGLLVGFKFDFGIYFFISAFGLCVLSYTWLIPWLKSYPLRYISGVFLLISSFIIGVFWANTFQFRPNANHFSNSVTLGNYYVFRVLSPPKETEKSSQHQVEVLAVKKGDSLYSVWGSGLLYLPKDSSLVRLSVGDHLISSKAPRLVAGPRNPLEFDYQKFLYRKKITHQWFLKRDDFHLMHFTQNGDSWRSFFEELRNKLLEVFETEQISEPSYSVIAALVFGDKTNIEGDMLTAFSQSGVVHVLAVSGLHVGLIYMVLQSLLAFMDRKKLTQWLKTIFILLALWTYALLTGLSPSVFRAATMFSFMVLAKVLFRNSTSYNTLAASALVLLLINPYQLFSLGFQLSYAAVLGILLTQRKIYGWFRFKRIWQNKIWELCSVSIAAQWFTLPLTLYYFHQFPTYFLLANLFVIPLATIILYLSFFCLLVNFIPFLKEFFMALLDGLIRLLNYIVSGVQGFPYPVVEGVFISGWGTLIFYLFIFGILVLSSNRNRKLVPVLMFLMAAFSITQYYSRDQNPQCWVYSVNGTSILGFYSNTSSCVIASEVTSIKDYDFQVKNHLEYMRVKPERLLDFATVDSGMVFKVPGFLEYNGITIAFPDELDDWKSCVDFPRVDFVYIKDNFDDFKLWKDRIDFKSVIIDSSVNLQVYERVIEWVNQNNYRLIDAYSIAQKILI